MTPKNPAIRIGTCGYSYDDWKGVFYPEKTPKGKFLEYYAEHFDTVELNATFYQLPALKTLEGMVKRTPEGFSFVIKAHQALTHARQDAEKVLPLFREALKPFSNSGKLGGVLLQFPYSFKPSLEASAHVEKMKAGLGEAGIVVEFRHRAWFTSQTLEWLKSRELSLCCVDEPQLPGLPLPSAEVTGPVGYVRFHGRNAEAWWGKTPAPAAGEYIVHDRGDGPDPSPSTRRNGSRGAGAPAAGKPSRAADASARYRYLYKEEELKEWVPRVREMGKKAKVVYALLNNHPDGYAIRNAKDFQRLMGAGEVAGL